MREIKQIVIHCSDTYPEMDIGFDEINKWHLDRGWSGIGYHYVIRRNGDVENGRDEATIGAHVAGHNANSIGICVVGGKAHKGENPCNFTEAQWSALEVLVANVSARFPDAKVMGHCDLDPNKTCPTFDAKAWWGAY